jgi:hypothetical protein
MKKRWALALVKRFSTVYTNSRIALNLARRSNAPPRCSDHVTQIVKEQFQLAAWAAFIPDHRIFG